MISGFGQVDEQKNINTREFFGILQYNQMFTPVQIARLNYLIESGIYPNVQNEYGDVPLYLCVKHNHYDLVKKLIQLGSYVNFGRGNFGSLPSPLHRAVKNRNAEMIALLINAGAEINALNSYGETPLHLAATCRETKIAQLLLSHGARIDIKDRDGQTPLHSAANYGCIDMVQFFLKNKFEIEAQDHKGNTALHYAVLKSPEITKLLLSAGADPSVKNNVGETPLHGVVGTIFNGDMINYEPIFLWIKKSFLSFIDKFIEAGWERFDILRNALGSNYALVETAEDMVDKIIEERKEQLKDEIAIQTEEQCRKQVEETIGMISELYPNAAKMAKPSLTRQLLDAIDYPPVRECAASSSSSSQGCTDDEQPPVMMIHSARKRFQREKDTDREMEEYEESTKRSRTGCLLP